MDRLKGIGSFVVLLLGMLAALRFLHVTLPLFYPQMLTGPFAISDLRTARSYLDFSPHVPFYRPQSLGPQPVSVTVTRRPYPEIVIIWQSTHFLSLSERKGGPMPASALTSRPLPGHPDSAAWQDGRLRRVIFKLGELWIDLQTDLSEQDVHRLVETLLPDKNLL